MSLRQILKRRLEQRSPLFKLIYESSQATANLGVAAETRSQNIRSGDFYMKCGIPLEICSEINDENPVLTADVRVTWFNGVAYEPVAGAPVVIAVMDPLHDVYHYYTDAMLTDVDGRVLVVIDLRDVNPSLPLSTDPAHPYDWQFKAMVLAWVDDVNQIEWQSATGPVRFVSLTEAIISTLLTLSLDRSAVKPGETVMASGYLTRADTGAPISAAPINLIINGSALISTSTGVDGRYSVSFPAPTTVGDYTITAIFPGTGELAASEVDLGFQVSDVICAGRPLLERMHEIAVRYERVRVVKLIESVCAQRK